MNDKIQPGNTVMWGPHNDECWCELYVLDWIDDEEGTFSAKIIDSVGFESHIGKIYHDWLPDYVK